MNNIRNFQNNKSTIIRVSLIEKAPIRSKKIKLMFME